ncbi:MAG: 50S ribosomal protein L22 [Acidimicrobiia bacterium]|nr:50S ribosomal protein L22 [Acidimicrobiia bacterium]MYC58310.1 50S ribosomal protein L22 [Acidimicrobiia bacterium]MYI29983.1 50S ribosomal protein L22 [Acidimicrobiia bacterium]
MAAITVENEARPGSRAVAKYVRSSAYKAREVLDLVRGKPYNEARDILTFSERSVSDTIAKCLDSAAANAEHNNELNGDELFVAACYADEGPTLKRWRPRARGRATRIRKRTCHITMILARYTEEEIEARDNRMALKSSGRRASASEARRRRVEASRQRDAEASQEDTETTQGSEEITEKSEETSDAEVTQGSEEETTHAEQPESNDLEPEPNDPKERES